jgi:ribosomal protein S18 acetylase RimI-like enzyme
MRGRKQMTTPDSITIRTGGSEDVETIAAFNGRLAMETEGKILDADTVRSGVARGLNLKDEVTYLLAEVDGKVVGQLMLTREWSDWRDGWIYWIQSVYVDEATRSRGIFRRLLAAARERLREHDDVCCLRLYVEDENTAAMTTYNRLGFHFPGYRVMEMQLDD